MYISNCGTYALVGYSSGHVDVFNMQSGKYKFSLKANRIACGGGMEQGGAVVGTATKISKVYFYFIFCQFYCHLLIKIHISFPRKKDHETLSREN